LVTRDRVGAALIIVAAIVGLVLVLSTAEPDDDDGGSSPSVSRVETPDGGPAQPIDEPDADDD
jgi:hypothetical protein